MSGWGRGGDFVGWLETVHANEVHDETIKIYTMYKKNFEGRYE